MERSWLLNESVYNQEQVPLKSKRDTFVWQTCSTERYLVFDGAEEQVEGLAGALAQKFVEQEGEPGREHLLGHRFGAAQQQLRVALALHALFDQLGQQRLMRSKPREIS